MIGAIIGDIAGSIYEFENIKTKRFPLFSSNCRFTDDSVMTAAVAEASMVYRQKKNDTLFEINVINSMHRLGRKYIAAGYGSRFREWLLSEERRPYGSYGNGSAMRVSAVAYVAESLQEAEKLAEISARVTHNHSEGIKGAKAVAAAVYMAICGSSKEEIKVYIKRKYYDIDFTLNSIRNRYVFDVSCRGSVPQALEAFFEAGSFEDAVRNAISIGGDSDTIACIAGAIAEPYFGIPECIRRRGLKFIDGTEILDIYSKFISALL